MATRKLNIVEMRDETSNIETEVTNIETALEKLNRNVLEVFPEGWNSSNASIVLNKITTMSGELVKIKNATRVLRERIDTHIGNVEITDTVTG